MSLADCQAQSTSVSSRFRTISLRRATGLAAIVGLTLWTYWGVLNAPFHFDDSLFLDSPQVSSPGDLAQILRPLQTRQFTYLTFYWNYRLGGAKPKGYHLVSLLLHLANVLLIYIFTRLLLERKTEWSDDAVRRLLPFAAAGIFALHPIQSEVVNYAYQRSTLLAAFFSLLALCVYLRAGKAPIRKLHLLPAAIFWLMAAASKESAWILPAILISYLWANSRDLRSFRTVLRQRQGWIVAALVVMVLGGGWAYFSLRSSGDRTVGEGLSGGPVRYLMAQVQVLATYLRLLIWPAGLSVDHDFSLAPFTSWYELYCILLLCVILVLTVRYRVVKPTIAFLGVSFLLFLAPTSSMVPSSDLLFEHRLYLPMITGSVLMAYGILSFGSLLRSERSRGTACLGLLILLLAVYALAARYRTYVWQDDTRLWTDAVAKAPGKARAHYNLGVAYLKLDLDKARQEFLIVTGLSPDHAQALYNLGWIDQTRGQYSTAREYYLASLKADSSNWRAHNSLGNLDVLQGQIREAMTEYRETIRLSPDCWPAYLSLAGLQIRQGNADEALPTLQKLLELRPDLLEGRFLRAYALVELGRNAEARAALHEVETRDTARSYGSRIEDLRHRMEKEAR